MAFVVGSVIIGAGAALGGAALSAKGAKDAAKTAAAGSDKEIAYNRESRDIALDLGSPYREAGYSALDKLGAMTGLLDSGGSFGRPSYQGEGAAVTGEGTPWGDSPWKLGFEDGKYTATLGEDKLFWDDSSESWMSSTGSAYGPKEDFAGRIKRGFAGRAGGGVLYNVNELGPESIYSGGSITRSSNPKTMPPDPRGYVHPNVQGKAIGGSMVDPNSMGDSVSITKNKDPFGYWRDGIPGQIQPGAVNDMPANTNYIDNRTGRAIEPWRRNMIAAGNLDPSSPGSNLTEMPADSGSSGALNPTGNPYDITTDPGYQFRLNEGMRALESSAAARGGLLSGGFGRKAIRYGQDYASNEFSNIYNRISNIAGLGQVSAGQGGVFAQNAGSQMGAAAGQGALSSAYGQMGATNAWSNAFNQIAQLPWDKIQWGGGGGSTGGTPGNTDGV